MSEPQRDVRLVTCPTCGGQGYVVYGTYDHGEGDVSEVSGICNESEGAGVVAPDAEKAGA